VVGVVVVVEVSSSVVVEVLAVVVVSVGLDVSSVDVEVTSLVLSDSVFSVEFFDDLSSSSFKTAGVAEGVVITESFH
jgi:hypothetical protein